MRIRFTAASAMMTAVIIRSIVTTTVLTSMLAMISTRQITASRATMLIVTPPPTGMAARVKCSLLASAGLPKTNCSGSPGRPRTSPVWWVILSRDTAAATAEVALDTVTHVVEAVVNRVAVLLNMLRHALVVLVDAVLHLVLVGQVDTEGTENTGNPGTSVATMLKSHQHLPSY